MTRTIGKSRHCKVAPIQTCSVGVTACAAGRQTLARTLASLHRAGFPEPRVFLDGPGEPIPDLPTTIHQPRVGGWPNFWLALTEMVCRQPDADLYLIVQDDLRAGSLYRTSALSPVLVLSETEKVSDTDLADWAD